MKLFISLLSLAFISANADSETGEPIYLKLNAKAVEVRQEHIERYRCEKGHLVASSSDAVSIRMPTRRVELRCVSQ